MHASWLLSINVEFQKTLKIERSPAVMDDGDPAVEYDLYNIESPRLRRSHSQYIAAECDPEIG